MRIAIISHNIVKGDGQGRVLRELVCSASARENEVTLVADRVDQNILGKSVRWVPIHAPVNRPNLAKVWGFARVASQFVKSNRGKFDIVHANGFVVDTAHDVNTCHMLHHAWRRSPAHTSKLRGGVYGAYHWMYSALNGKWEQKAYRKAELTIAVSELVKVQLKTAGIDGASIAVVPNGVDLAEFRPGQVRRSELGIPEGYVALFVGDIRSPLKNLDVVLDAVELCPEIHLAVVGNTIGSRYPDIVRQRDLADRVHFLGFRSDVATIMRVVDVLVVPSHYESFSLALLEGMASALPVITARTVGAADLVDASCGFVMEDPGQSRELAAILDALCKNVDLGKTLGQNARKVAEQFSWEKMGRRYLEQYDQVLERRRSARCQIS